MEQIILRRVAYNVQGVQGVLIYRNRGVMLTLEDAWHGNERMISCIPVGQYQCKRHSTAKYPNTWALQDVPGRTAILIHAGNTEDSTNGCILLGSKFGDIGGKPAVMDSQAAMVRFRHMTSDWKEFTLIVEHGGYGVDI